MNISNFWTR